MATQTRAVTGEGGQTEGGYVGGAADYTVMNSDDMGTSLLQYPNPGSTYYHCWEFQDFSSGDITNVAIRVRVYAITYGGISRTYVRIGGTNYYSTSYSIPTTGWFYVDRSWATDPSTGLSWIMSGLNSAQFGEKREKGINIANRISFIQMTVTYIPTTPRSRGIII